MLYDELTNKFYVLASYGGSIYSFYDVDGVLVLEDVHIIPEIKDSYIRSINIIDGYMYFVSGPNAITKIDYQNDWLVVDQYDIPDELWGMNYIIKIEDYYYMTIYTDKNWDTSYATIIRTVDLDGIMDGNYEIIYEQMGLSGVPYFINYFDNKYYITEIDNASGIRSFEIIDNQICNMEIIYFEGKVSQDSINRKEMKFRN